MNGRVLTLADHQRDVRVACAGGGTGMVVSGLLWLGCGAVALMVGPRAAMLANFFGGMLIFPVALLVDRAFGRSGLLADGNPLGDLARESAFMMVVCIPLAFVAAMVRPEWFFPAMLVLVGAHYWPFATLYGMRLYWALGAAMIGAGFLLAWAGAAVATGAFAGGAIELLFAPFAYAAVRRELAAQAA
jgi:hypothetical protein